MLFQLGTEVSLTLKRSQFGNISLGVDGMGSVWFLSEQYFVVVVAGFLLECYNSHQVSLFLAPRLLT